MSVSSLPIKSYSIYDPNAIENMKLNELYGQADIYCKMLNENNIQSRENESSSILSL